MASEISSVWNDILSAIKRLLKTSTKEKLVFCSFFGFTYALISANDRTDLVDKFIAGIIYFLWAVFLLPTLKSKLSVEFLWNAGTIFLTLFAADMMYFGFYHHAKNTWFSNKPHKFVEYQSLIFFMNVVRIFVILFCLVTSSSAFIRHHFKSMPFRKPKKEEPIELTPHSMRLRSSCRSK